MSLRTYVTGSIPLPVLDPESDPGRERDITQLESLYGSGRQSIEENLISISFLNHAVLFNSQNQASDSLFNVGLELLKRCEVDEKLRIFLEPWLNQQIAPMTYIWRNVRGAKRLSAHAFGIAIDLYNPETKEPVYWLWEVAKEKAAKLAQNGIKKDFGELFSELREEDATDFRPKQFLTPPWGLIDAFENHGFIWGGKWYHYDSIHFEYRPELF